MIKFHNDIMAIRTESKELLVKQLSAENIKLNV